MERTWWPAHGGGALRCGGGGLSAGNRGSADARRGVGESGVFDGGSGADRGRPAVIKRGVSPSAFAATADRAGDGAAADLSRRSPRARSARAVLQGSRAARRRRRED